MADYAFLELPVNICGRFVQLRIMKTKLPDVSGRRHPLLSSTGVRRTGIRQIQKPMPLSLPDDAEMEIDNDLRTGTLQKISKG